MRGTRPGVWTWPSVGQGHAGLGVGIGYDQGSCSQGSQRSIIPESCGMYGGRAVAVGVNEAERVWPGTAMVKAVEFLV